MHRAAKKLTRMNELGLLAKTFRAGRTVEAFWSDSKWYPATVRLLNWKQESIIVDYNDGTHNTLYLRDFESKPVRPLGRRIVWRLRSKRPHVGMRRRLTILKRQRFSCNMCWNEIDAECDLDHISPKRLETDPATTDNDDNLQYLCKKCHREKTLSEHGITL